MIRRRKISQVMFSTGLGNYTTITLVIEDIYLRNDICIRGKVMFVVSIFLAVCVQKRQTC